MPDALHQINLKYSPEQDRLALRLRTMSDGETVLLLSRRFVRAFWPGLLEALGKDPRVAPHARGGAREAVMAFRHEHAVKASNFSTPYKPPAKAPPFATPAVTAENADPPAQMPAPPEVPKEEKADEPVPMLVTACQMRPSKERVMLSFRTDNGRSVALDLSFDMLHGLCRLIQQAAGSADWALNLDFGPPAAQPNPAAGPVH